MTDKDYPQVPGEGRFNPWLFFGVLMAPGVAATVTMIWERLDDLAYGLLLGGSVVAGLFCGIYLAVTLARNQTSGVQGAIGLVAVIGCGLGAFALGFGTCLLVHGGSH